MGSFSQVEKACRSLKFIVVEDRLQRFAIKRKIERRSKLLRMRTKLKKERITNMCTDLAVHVRDNVACMWESESKVKNISRVRQKQMVAINWMRRHQGIRAGLRFAVVDEVQFVADVMGSEGLDMKPRMIEISDGVSIGWIHFENESDEGAWRVIDGLVAETGYNADKAKKASKKARRVKEHGKIHRVDQMATTSATAVPQPSSHVNVVILDVKEEPMEETIGEKTIDNVNRDPGMVSKKNMGNKRSAGIKEKGKKAVRAGSSRGTVHKHVLRKGNQSKKGKGKASTDITEELSNGAKKFTWKTRITNGKKSAKNVMHFPKEIAKKCLRVYQDEIKVVDAATRKVFNCSLHKARRKGVPSTYERTIEQLGMESNWERLKRETEIRRVLELIHVVGEWRKVWERYNRRKWKGCLWRRENDFKAIMAGLAKRRTSIEWKAAWQSSKSGVYGKCSANTEAKTEEHVVVGAGERKRMSRREAQQHVIVLSLDSEREERYGKKFNKPDKSKINQEGPSNIAKERDSDRKGKGVMEEDEDDHVSISSDKEGHNDDSVVIQNEKSWIKVVTKPPAMGTQVLQIPAEVITGCELEGKNTIGLYDTNRHRAYNCMLKKREDKNEMFLCRGWYEFGKRRTFKKGDVLQFTIRYPPVEEILASVLDSQIILVVNPFLNCVQYL
ncbi:uncharacterized protein LOC131653913 [Vicia villosa]|uniref:uncharacterized protein LOC131653913 n=1 Tax=Vicia villosa TaxID=3911 RepID=UPI00273AB658|nr:uncharacterized protein LOC131653913 [Vicia villosa]